MRLVGNAQRHDHQPGARIHFVSQPILQVSLLHLHRAAVFVRFCVFHLKLREKPEAVAELVPQEYDKAFQIGLVFFAAITVIVVHRLAIAANGGTSGAAVVSMPVRACGSALCWHAVSCCPAFQHFYFLLQDVQLFFQRRLGRDGWLRAKDTYKCKCYHGVTHFVSPML